MPLLDEYWSAGREHYGIIVSEQLPVGELLRRVLRMLDSVSADEMKNSFRNLGEFKESDSEEVEMQTMTFPKVLQEARRLPPEAQLELAEELLREVGLPRFKKAKSPRALIALGALGIEELQSLADAVVAPSRQRRLRALLRKNREQVLNRTEQVALDDLTAETDHIALLKARALYTLVRRGKKAIHSK